MKSHHTEHQMKLYDMPFQLMKSGKKTIEVRCNDEKRSGLRVGDRIVFSRASNPAEKLYSEIVAIQRFATFKELYAAFPLDLFGVPDASVEEMLTIVDTIYSKEEQEKYGAIAISIQLI